MSPSPPLDLAIVGGGPAGLFLALCLRDLGTPLRMAVLEQARYPRFKVCAGGLAGGVAPLLERLRIPVPEPNVPMAGATVFFRGRRLDVEQPGMGWVVRRDVLDAALAGHARRRDVDLREGFEVRSLSRDGDLWLLRGRQGEVRARAVALCTGAAGKLHRQLGIVEGRRRARLAMIEGPRGPRDPTDRFVFDLGELGRGVQGYLWDFPYVDAAGQPGVNRGVMDHQGEGRRRFPRADLPDLLAARSTRAGVDPRACTRHAFSERLFLPRTTFALPGVILVGEAVGIDPLFGEGIAEAMEMAAIAALHVDRGLRERRRGRAVSPPAFPGYRRHVLRSRLGRALRVLQVASGLAYGRSWPKMIRFLFEVPEVGRDYCAWFAGEKLPLRAYVRGGLKLGAALLRPAGRSGPPAEGDPPAPG